MTYEETLDTPKYIIDGKMHTGVNRLRELLDNCIFYITECASSDEEAFNTLVDCVGFTEQECREFDIPIIKKEEY